MMALSATSRDGVMLQGYGLGDGTAPTLVGGFRGGFRGGFGAQPTLVGVGATALMGLGADGDVVVPRGAAATAFPLIGLVLGAAVSAGITTWMFSASRSGSNIKPGLVAGGSYLAGGLLIALLARSAV
jgi:hypothetical protein